MKKKKNTNTESYYIDPTVFKEQMREYYDTDVMTNELAENLVKIANGLSYKPSFINYTWKNDMIGDALIKMYSALKYKKYKFSKDTNPFSYFTTVAFNAFINRIKKEQRHHKALKEYKEQVYEDVMTDPNSCNGQLYVKPNKELNLDGDPED